MNKKRTIHSPIVSFDIPVLINPFGRGTVFTHLIRKKMLKSLLIGIFLQLTTGLFAQVPGSKEITLNQTISYGEKVVTVSFNGDDSAFGDFRITDANGRVVLHTEQAELIPSPNYFAVNIDGFEAGAYVFAVRTKKGTYSTTYTLR